ncbi:uncharacterized protein [Elaeis guineensis]|uniref:Uncharacterized protein LOC105033506 isoform X3 n=1 Tax=Elaeis guineensis var. tenera TaxID=51953 RepID=A0A6I9QCY1_ELAGV|nr:uncharacterized protein LOC105033506 isoform X3 [Elaeis guineensis]
MEVEDDEEEEDIDFNPFLKGETLSEASSGLSSDNEGLISKVDKILQRSQHKDATTSSRANMEIVCCSTDSGNEDEETVMQTRLASEDSYGKESISEKPTTRELTTSTEQGGGLTCDGGCIKELLCRDGSDAADLTKEEFLEQTTGSLNPRNFQDPIVEIDDEDAICKRTRAHHSLAHYTLEELEAFLQESDDDDDMQNPDDEEEYHKFLAAVLLEGADNKQTGQEHENVEEDEENDADFEIELEEALESDVDESTDNNRGLSDKQEEDRPETRHKKRLRESAENKNYSLGQAKMPLRTILPFVSNAQVAPFPPSGWQFSSPQSFTHCPPSFSGADLVNGFTSEQIGQLYCLIHEHVQLLIQVFSVCVLDPSRQQVAFQVRKMIMEMVDRHEEALACRKVPYPRSCFQPSNLCSSLHADFHQIPEFSNWTPLLDNLVLSVLDVAPLRLAKSYMTDVSEAVLRYRQNHVQDATDKSHLKRVPLFPLPMFASHSETNNDHLGRATTTSSKTASPSPAQVQPKKSLAATLVESTMKQSVALVPLDIARLAQKFFPLFNLALFPHKPPMPAVANRVLFTDAEDRLLAMGLMEYNNDWGAIHQHFLPCKTKHQIFVRQKNRSSSKAPENPIKAVRRMKTSPLTTDEKSQINEGLKLFKHDWLSIWKFFVPHRDPSLLPRQWRIATGTQKSYKKSEDDKEKRRLYEAKRRKIKASMTDKEVTSELEVDNGANSADDMDNEDEAFVHEAFLADSEHKFEASRQESEAGHELVTSSKPSVSMLPLSNCSGSKFSASYRISSKQLSSTSKSRARSHLGSLPYQRRRRKGVRIVKLAPDLPPVNLPPSVRVISQSAFQSYHSGPSCFDFVNNERKKLLSSFLQAAKPDATVSNPSKQLHMSSDNCLEVSCQQDGGTSGNQLAEENTFESDLQMHPLLFQAPEDQFSSYYSMNCYNTTTSTYNFFPRSQLQTDPNFFKSQKLVRTTNYVDATQNPKGPPSDLCTIDFHPLLQRTDNVSGDSATISSINPLSGGSGAQNNCGRFVPSDCLLREPLVEDGEVANNRAAPCHYGKENKLDLDIHLGSMMDKENTIGGGVMNEHQHVESDSPTLEQRMTVSGVNADLSISHCKDRCPDVLVSSGSIISEQACSKMYFDSVAVQSSKGGACECRGDFHDESLPEIVMEQEELSDSDEESEQVEFECEEMDDSEEDELDATQPSETPNKGIRAFAPVGEKIQADHKFNQCQSRSLTQGSVDKGKNYASPVQTCPGSCHDKLSRLKPKDGSAKRERSCRSSPNVSHSHLGRTSKARNSKNSKTTQRPHSQAVNEHETVASRKPRKRSVLN